MDATAYCMKYGETTVFAGVIIEKLNINYDAMKSLPLMALYELLLFLYATAIIFAANEFLAKGIKIRQFYSMLLFCRQAATH